MEEFAVFTPGTILRSKKLTRPGLIYLGAYNTNALLSPHLDPTSGKYKFIQTFPKNTKMPTIDPNNSTGPFVRALIEDEDPGTNLLAYDSYPTLGDYADAWSKASGKEAEYVVVTTDFLHQTVGIPKQILVGLDAMKEFGGYMGGVEFIEPFQLKKKVHTKSIETWLNERDWKAVLDTKPVMRSLET
jgi:hypothetical protein